jgi:sRNA-binding regulator protein Hfq
MENSVTKIQEDYMYKNFGIIPNQLYNFQFKNGLNIDGVIMNFDSNTFCIKGVNGMYMIVRGDIDSVYPSKISKDEWEESRLQYLKSFIETN